MKNRYVLPCGCATVLDFSRGERLVTCDGEGLTPKNGSTARGALMRCPGQRRWRVTAAVVPTVRYDATEMRKADH